MEPRQGGRFHIWHILGRERCLFATYALRKTVLSSARTARLNGLRGFGPRSRVRDIFGSGNHYSAVLNGSAIGYTCGAWLVTHRTVLQTKSVSHMIRRRSTQQDTKNPGRKGPGVRNQWRLSQRMIARIRRTNTNAATAAPKAERRIT